MINLPQTFTMTVDLSETSPYARSSYSVLNGYGTSPELKTMVYGSNWIFDSTTLISVCSDVDGNSRSACFVQNLRVTEKVPLQLEAIHFSNIRNLLIRFFLFIFFIAVLKGDYQLKEVLGSTTISATYGTLGSGVFCNLSFSLTF